MPRLVLFDIDGTLILSGGAGQKAFAKVCHAEFNFPRGADKLQFAGRTDTSIVRSFFASHDIEPSRENFDRFFKCYLELLTSSLAENNGWVLPGIHRLIEGLRSFSHPPAIGLLTGNIRPGAKIKLGHYHLWEHFAFGAFGDDHEDRREIAKVAHKRGSQHLGESLSGDQIVVIGDTPLDIDCAHAIQARCLAVATGSYSVDALQQHKPAWAVETLENIHVEEIMAGSPD